MGGMNPVGLNAAQQVSFLQCVSELSLAGRPTVWSTLPSWAREFVMGENRVGNDPTPFSAVGKVDRSTFLFFDNRPKGPNVYDARIGTAYGDLVRMARSNGMDGLAGAASAAGLPVEFVTNAAMRMVVSSGLRTGAFKDTARLDQWTRELGRDLSLQELDLPEPQFVAAHGDSDIDWLWSEMVDQGHLPGALFLSGSPRMLSDDKDHRVVKKTIELVQHLHSHRVPIFGICFGLHLLGYACYGALVDWLRIPEGMHVRVAHEVKRGTEQLQLGNEVRKVVGPQHVSTRFIPVTPGEKQMIYGPWKVNIQRPHPVFRHVGRTVTALEVHSQYLRYPNDRIPEAMVLATSRRLFRPDRMSPASEEYSDAMIEVLDCGDDAVGTQLHPEMLPHLILALSYMPAIEESLRSEGHDVGLIRGALALCLDGGGGFPASQRIAYNWVRYVAGRRYVEWLMTQCANDPIRTRYLHDVRHELLVMASERSAHGTKKERRA